MSTLYKIRDWNLHYENNQTRPMKNMSWLKLPVKLSGNGYVHLMGVEEGAAIFGCFIATIEAAANCRPRGELWATPTIPHSPRTLAAVVRQSEQLVSKMLAFCNSDFCDWIETTEIKDDTRKCVQSAS